MALLAAVFQVTHCSVLGLNSREERVRAVQKTREQSIGGDVYCIFRLDKVAEGGGGGRKINCLEKAQGLICNM